MERLTLSDYGRFKIPPPTGTKEKERPSYMDLYCRLAAIEDILGDEYELDYLRELVEVVRCRECRHSSPPSGFTQRYGEPGTLSCHYGPCNRRNVKEDDFCSYGQRKEVDHA